LKNAVSDWKDIKKTLYGASNLDAKINFFSLEKISSRKLTIFCYLTVTDSNYTVIKSCLMIILKPLYITFKNEQLFLALVYLSGPWENI
jgi:hypothetical protein